MKDTQQGGNTYYFSTIPYRNRNRYAAKQPKPLDAKDISAKDLTKNNAKAKAEEKQGNAIAAMVLGILSLVSSGLNFIFAIISLCLVRSSRRENNGTLLPMAKAGKVCSIISIVLFWIAFLVVLSLFIVYGTAVIDYAEEIIQKEMYF